MLEGRGIDELDLKETIKETLAQTEEKTQAEPQNNGFIKKHMDKMKVPEKKKAKAPLSISERYALKVKVTDH